MEEHVSAKQNEADLDVVLNLRAFLEPFRRADGVGDDHADGDGPDFGIGAVAAHGHLVAEDVGDDAEHINAEEGHEEAAHVEAHDRGADGDEHAEAEPEHDERGDAVEGLDDFLGSVGGGLLGALPHADELAGRLVQRGVLIAGFGGESLGGLGGVEGRGFGGLGLVHLGLHGGVHLVGVSLAQDEGVQRIGAPAGRRLDVVDERGRGGELLALKALLGGGSVIPLNGLEGFFGLGLEGGRVLVILGLQFALAAENQADGNDDQEEANPDGPVVFLLPEIGELRFPPINNNVGVCLRHPFPSCGKSGFGPAQTGSDINHRPPAFPADGVVRRHTTPKKSGIQAIVRPICHFLHIRQRPLREKSRTKAAIGLFPKKV